MKVRIFVREPNSTTYTETSGNTTVIPRMDETISVESGKSRKYYQVIGVHHLVDSEEVEIFAVETEPVWKVKKPGSIGFNFR